MHSSVRFELRGSTLIIVLQSPDQFPRLTKSVLQELTTRFESIPADSAVGAAIITGTPQSFAAGADIAEVSLLTPLEALSFSALGQSLMRAVESCSKPVIAAIRGYCLGGGFDLALACHLRIAGNDAQFGHPGGSLGIITGWGGTARLPRIVGQAHARELLVTGRVITAAEAYSMHLVSRVVPPEEVLDAAMEIARHHAQDYNRP